MIHGMVDHPVIFTMEDLRRLPSVTRIHFLECIGNTSVSISATAHMGESARRHEHYKTVQESHGLTSCSEWTGVLLSVLLKEAGVQKGVKWLLAEGADPPRLSFTLPLAKAMDDMIVAYGQNGEPLRPEQGFPVRLVVPGFVGHYNIKYLGRIQVGDQPFMTREDVFEGLQSRPDGKAHWAAFQLGPKSVITFPSGGQQLPGRGFYEITGLAWSGSGAVQRVELSTDGGRNWKDAQLDGPVHRMAHTRFRMPWEWNGEEVEIQSRCTDELGQVQPTLPELCELMGMSFEDFKKPSTLVRLGRVNAIQAWKVTREGSVENAMDL